jgi:hypothetical protein
MKKWKRWALLALLAIVVALVSAAGVRSYRANRQLAQVKQMQKELFSPETRGLSPEERREKFQNLRELQKGLTQAQRDALMAEARKRRQEQMNRYFAMSQAEKTRHLDEQIQRMEERRRQFQANAAQRGGSPGGGPNGRGPGGAGGPGQPGAPDRSVATRDRERQARLDSTSPTERAQFTQYMKDLNARRTQLGLPPGGPGGPGGGRGFGPQR